MQVILGWFSLGHKETPTSWSVFLPTGEERGYSQCLLGYAWGIVGLELDCKIQWLPFNEETRVLQNTWLGRGYQNIAVKKCVHIFVTFIFASIYNLDDTVLWYGKRVENIVFWIMTLNLGTKPFAFCMNLVWLIFYTHLIICNLLCFDYSFTRLYCILIANVPLMGERMGKVCVCTFRYAHTCTCIHTWKVAPHSVQHMLLEINDCR